MSEFITSLQGTEAGHQLALVLALFAAVLHAVFGALQKGRHDPWLTRGAIDLNYGLMAAPFALFVVPWPEPHMWVIFGWVFVIHVGYKLFQGQTYMLGGYTVVYPVVRGMGPFFTVIGAGYLFGESFTPMQWAGVGVLMAGILGLAVYNIIFMDVDRRKLVKALGMAVITGGFVALYTTYDAYGIRATADPFTFLAWFFMIDGLLFMPWFALIRWRGMAERPPVWPLLKRGWVGAVIAFLSFGSVMLATRLDKVGEAAVLRETSVLFAAAIGWIFLNEKIGPRRLTLMAMIAAGAVLVEMGG